MNSAEKEVSLEQPCPYPYACQSPSRLLAEIPISPLVRTTLPLTSISDMMSTQPSSPSREGNIMRSIQGHKGGIFTPLKAKIDQTITTVETVTDIIENIADQADKLVDEIESKLPEDSNLVETVEKLDKLTDIALEKAKQAEEIVQQVKEVKDHIFEHVIQDDNTDDDTTKANK
ncbi:uncharacterized protein LOC127260350 isoform X3 [Andrographis paniculata]|uniref:uncharacterized protein LOC127260350 isoform X3 n=1 Tax=Andrographis paniculata TaxID=175694 RepID=UPI0021E79EF5|nr:uncharacterized protein LOC127260350 isoform X3 [Andrographis paniculata]